MKKTYFVWSLLLLASAYSDAAKSNNICDTCKCTPNATPEKARSVECTCDSATRTVNTTTQNMQNLPHLESFTVRNCDGVYFHENSFGQSHDLSNVILKRVKTAVFTLGVFAKLDSLKIEDVEDLRLMDHSFMGADIGEIAIRNSTIREIPAWALYDVKLQKLEFTDVNIGLVRSNSTLFKMGQQSNLKIDGCQMDQVESSGLVLMAQNVHIRESSLTNLSPSAIVIDAAIGIDIVTTTFGTSDPRGMSITSKSINIFNNTFNNIPITLGSTGEGGKVTITKNIIHDIEFELNVLGFISAEFLRNFFLCDCALAAKLNAMLSVKEFYDKAKVQCAAGEVVDLCSVETRVTEGTDHDHVSTEVSGRSGRRDDHDEEHQVETSSAIPSFTEEGSARNSGQPKFGSSAVLIVSFLMSLFLLF